MAFDFAEYNRLMHADLDPRNSVPMAPSWRDNPLFGFDAPPIDHGTSRFTAFSYLLMANFTEWTITGHEKVRISLRPNTSPEPLCVIWNWHPRVLTNFLLSLRDMDWLTDELTVAMIGQIDQKFTPRYPSDGVLPKRRDKLPKSLRLAVLGKTSGRCVYCGTHLVMTANRPNSFHADHVLPVEKGGSDDIANLVPACATCNVKKSKKTALQFLGTVIEDGDGEIPF